VVKYLQKRVASENASADGSSPMAFQLFEKDAGSSRSPKNQS